MSCGAALRVNGQWVDIPGIQSGLTIDTARPTSEFVSVGGVRHTQSARRAPRTWQINLGEQVSPEAVAALMTAAQGDGGDVMLWDESAARANLLDPVAVRGRDTYPVVDCGGVPLRSLTAGSSSSTMSVDHAAVANASITSTASAVEDFLTLTPTTQALIKFSVPATPAGWTLVGAQLVLTRAFGSGGVDVHHASGSWVEISGPAPYWTTVPSGALAGSGAAAVETVISLSGVGSYAGTDMTLRLVGDSVLTSFRSRRNIPGAPVLRLTYQATPQDRVITQHLREGDWSISCWTDAAPTTELAVLTAPSSTVRRLRAPEGSGVRLATYQTSISTAPRDWTLTVPDSTSYVLAGLMLSTLTPAAYIAPHKTPVRVVVDDPTLTLTSLYSGEQGKGPRTVTIREQG